MNHSLQNTIVQLLMQALWKVWKF